MLHLVRREEDLVFLDVSAENCHLGHSAQRQESRPDAPVRYGPEVPEGCGFGTESDYHHFPEDGGLRSEGRFPAGRRE